MDQSYLFLVHPIHLCLHTAYYTKEGTKASPPILPLPRWWYRSCSKLLLYSGSRCYCSFLFIFLSHSLPPPSLPPQNLLNGGRTKGRPKSRHQIQQVPTLSSINERRSAAASRASNYSTASAASAAVAPWNCIRLGLSQKSCR